VNRGQRVLIVDDHPVVRHGLLAMLDGEPWVDEVFEAGTAAGAVTTAVADKVTIVVMDVALPDGDGVDAARRIVLARPQVQILILSMIDDQDVVARALRAGAHGYLLKDADPDAVVDALRVVASGGVVLGPRIGSAAIGQLQRVRAELPAPFDRLTARERDILNCLAAGETNARIARRLGLSDKTVRNQVSGVFAKLGVNDRVRAALFARDAGFGQTRQVSTHAD
jgi:two-component system nitrate/nitrite response regulator NarL